MNIPEKINVEVYLNGKYKNFKFIGSYNSEYGTMGVECINLILPISMNEIESWNEIKNDVSPVEEKKNGILKQYRGKSYLCLC